MFVLANLAVAAASPHWARGPGPHTAHFNRSKAADTCGSFKRQAVECRNLQGVCGAFVLLCVYMIVLWLCDEVTDYTFNDMC